MTDKLLKSLLLEMHYCAISFAHAFLNLDILMPSKQTVLIF